MPKKEKLFVYGTLKFSRFQKVAFGRSAKGRTALLENYIRSKADIHGGRYFVISARRGSIVKGLVLEVSKKELISIDAHEGEGYVRKKVRLGDGTFAWTYVHAAVQKSRAR